MSALLTTPRKSRGRLPSVEAQTLAYIERARRSGGAESAWMRWQGFEVYLRYQPHCLLTDGEVLIIASIVVPKPLRRRGWFWRYCQFCAVLALGGVLIECVNNTHLAAALRRHREFVEYEPHQFYLRKMGPADWPLPLP